MVAFLGMAKGRDRFGFTADLRVISCFVHAKLTGEVHEAQEEAARIGRRSCVVQRGLPGVCTRGRWSTDRYAEVGG